MHLTCQGGNWLLKAEITGQVVAGRGGEHPPPPTPPLVQRLTLSFLSQPLRGEDLSAVACLTVCSVYIGGIR